MKGVSYRYASFATPLIRQRDRPPAGPFGVPDGPGNLWHPGAGYEPCGMRGSMQPERAAWWLGGAIARKGSGEHVAL
jgi:hypothetical protein